MYHHDLHYVAYASPPNLLDPDSLCAFQQGFLTPSQSAWHAGPVARLGRCCSAELGRTSFETATQEQVLDTLDGTRRSACDPVRYVTKNGRRPLRIPF